LRSSDGTTSGRPANPGRMTPASERRRGLLTIEDAAAYLGLSPGTLRNWISMRRIDYVKVGRLTRISVVTLDRYIAANTVRAEGNE
jgi:excisionase family DNA binding protein